jgi:2-methylcitrate dehydratase PrpD
VKTEQELVSYICRTTLSDIPPAVMKIAKNQVLTDVGTTIAGASADGCETLVTMAKDLGGKTEASILIYGGKVPAQQAAFLNATMARALDFDDSVAPGAHIGTATIAAALATAELVGGASGADFLAALCVGTEVGLRMNLWESEYDGFDPTGVCVPFASTAAAAKILRLSEAETWNALALAFCRCGGSFQANVDGVLATRVIEGWVAETGVTCARLAGRGITGPTNFLEGVYGYFHLFGRDRVTGESVVSGLGTDYQAGRLVFKKYPSCAGTQASTQTILDLMADESLAADNVEHVDVTVPPYIYKLVGHPFQVGSNPKVNAQFSIRYCVANALLRKESKLAHFEADAIKDPFVLDLVDRIEVVPDAAMDVRGHTALDMRVLTKDGREYLRSTDAAPGTPQRPLTQEEHLQRIRDLLAFTAKPPAEETVAELMAAVEHLEEMKDIRILVSLLLPQQ